MIKSTKDYDQFILRNDNRAKIEMMHVKKLVASISAHNFLYLRPIVVNGKMEVIDGQHRLMAARELGVEIYYEVEEALTNHDIILMNVQKTWSMVDYFNFYLKNDYEEYKKLAEFMRINELSLMVALNICLGQGHQGFSDFRNGTFKLKHDVFSTELQICWDTIHYINKMNGTSKFTLATRFWKALLKLVRHPNFDETKWISNYQRMTERFCPKINEKEYLRLFLSIYNFKNTFKISFEQIEEYEQ